MILRLIPKAIERPMKYPQRQLCHSFASLAVSLCLVFADRSCVHFAMEPNDSERIPWTGSRVVGTPDRPPAYTLERAFPKLSFKGPVSLHRFPQSNPGDKTRWIVIEQRGKIVSFLEDEEVENADVMMDLGARRPKLSEFDGKGGNLDVYSMAFHPKFLENRYVYLCYVVFKGKINPNGTHIARYKVLDTNPPTIDYDSETTILRCDAGGHNGSTIEFGPDGCLYISIGDLTDPTPPDILKTGQDISDLYSSILRIDVDHPSIDANGVVRPYSIPTDNPFADLSYARGEVYAYGLRNPWRMSFDSATGDLWVGDVGWEAFEMVHRVKPGSNLGWSIKEGPGDVMPELQRGPTPIQPPEIALTHADAASVTGGVVYRGRKHTDLVGKYIFGDWITRRYWAASFDESKVTSLEEIATTEVKPICFATDRDGEIYVLEFIQSDQQGGIYRLKRNPLAEKYSVGQFPTRLSQTGIFKSISDLIPEAGVYEYSLQSTMWMDGATPRFHLAIPGTGVATLYQSGQKTFDWFMSKVQFPQGTVLAKTYHLENRKIETQLSHYEGPNDWRFYTYRWLPDESDAILVPMDGESTLWKTKDGRDVRWTYSSRSQCKMCHTPWSGDALGFLEEQLRAPHRSNDSFRELIARRVLQFPADQQPKPNDRFVGFAGGSDPTASVNQRARSYLHSNCAHCHQFGGNGAAAFDVRWDRTTAEMKVLEAVPMKGSCGLTDAKLIAPGDPGRSVLFSRMAKSGSGRMPHVGAETVDVEGVKLIADWIFSIPRDESLRNSYVALLEPVQKGSVDQRVEAVKKLMESIPGAILVARAVSDSSVHDSIRKELLSAMNQSVPETKDFVEHLLPETMRLQKLGSMVDPAKILAIEGNIERGAAAFKKGFGQCNQCHKIGDQGKAIGPALDTIAKKYPSRDLLLTQIIKPSETIDPEYRAVVFLTSDGETVAGRVVERDEKTIQLSIQDGTLRRIDVASVESEKPSQVSLMPENLVAGMSAEQLADLLAYLAQLK
jgi:putative heme-binding domain-containing protein